MNHGRPHAEAFSTFFFVKQALKKLPNM